jgi:malate dehydrogenase
MRHKVTIVGAGNVGATAAQRIAESELADVVLIDILEGIPQGKGLDIWESAPVCGFSSQVSGSNHYAYSADSQLVIITAGVARKPGMSREDLLATNARIVSSVVREVADYSPQAIILVVTNPLDAMAWLVKRISGFPKERVVGMAGILDSSRFRSFIARELRVSPQDVQALVLGGHGDTMVPLPRYTSVGGVPLTELLAPDRIEALVQRTRQGGAEIVGHLKTGSAYYAPSAAVWEMAEAILRDKQRFLPASAYLEGEYGLADIYLGVPVVLGASGVERVVELELTPQERESLNRSAAKVQESIKLLNQLI